MSKYTKGPWEVSSLQGIRGTTVYSNAKSNYPICELYRRFFDDEEAEANARLIAAAPELLEALQTLVDDCIHASGSMDYNYGEFDLKAAEAAILKAKGDQQ